MARESAIIKQLRRLPVGVSYRSESVMSEGLRLESFFPGCTVGDIVKSPACRAAILKAEETFWNWAQTMARAQRPAMEKLATCVSPKEGAPEVEAVAPFVTQHAKGPGLRVPDALAAGFARVLEDMNSLFRYAWPMLLQAAEAVERVQKSPPIKGYEGFLIQRGYRPLDARLIALMVIEFGERRRQEVFAERRLAAAVFALGKAEGRSSLIISRRANDLNRVLEEPLVEDALMHARSKARVMEWIGEIKGLLRRAIDRDKAACRRVVEIATTLRAHLRDPRGRVPSLASVRHELLLHLVKKAYTFDVVDDEITDAATQATRILMNDPDFDPRPARRRLRARQAA